jgi:hypothetical protein
MPDHHQWRVATVVLAVLLFLLTGHPAMAAPACTPPPSGLVAWWTADGTDADIKGGHDGTRQNGATYGAGRVGQAFSLDGTNDFVQVADSDAWTFGASDFTLDFWVRFAAVPGGSVGNPGAVFLGHDEGGGSTNKWFFGLGGGVLHFHVNRPGGPVLNLVPSAFAPTAGPWYHLAITRSSGTFTVYVDGEVAGSQAIVVVIPNAAAPLTIGQAEGLGFLNGLIDEIEIAGRALSQDELRAIVAAGAAGKCRVDHFLCYKAPLQQKFLPVTVALVDDVASDSYAVKKPAGLCTPVDKNAEGTFDEVTHLQSYLVTPSTRPAPPAGLVVDNQFGTLTIDAIKADRLLVPTAKGESGPVDPPDPGSHLVNHYACYKAKVTRGTSPFVPRQVAVVDQFGQPKVLDVKKPSRLCLPADKNGEGVEEPATPLLCYLARPARGEPKHVSRLLDVNNQLGPGQVKTVVEDELCVPSAVTLPLPPP